MENPYFNEVSNIRESFGQIMQYDDTINGAIYLFENIGGANQSAIYTIVYNNIEKSFEQQEHMSFSQVNQFGGSIYVFCYSGYDEISGDFYTITCFELTKELELEKEWIVDLKQMNLSYMNLLNHSLVVHKGYLYFPVQYNHRFYTVAYDLETQKGNMCPVDYVPVSCIVNNDTVYSVGAKANKFIVEELYESKPKNRIETDFPGQNTVRFDLRKEYLYGADDVIYGAANDRNNCTIVFSYDLKKQAWSNWWKIDTNSSYLLADYKFVFRKDNKQFDLLPYQTYQMQEF